MRTLQHYDEQGLLHPHHKSAAGYRFYSSEDLQIIQKISVLKYIGFSVKQIKTILQTNLLDRLNSLGLQAKILNCIFPRHQGAALFKVGNMGGNEHLHIP